MQLLSWLLRLLAAGILLQTLYFKFTGAPESVYIFSTLGVEPWGRLASGALELVAAILLLVPTTVAKGAVLSLGVISGALLAHIFVLGVEVQGDGGLLCLLAIVVFLCSAALAWMHRNELRAWMEMLRGR